MCGICGFVGRPAPDVLTAMCDVLVHRGPDGDGMLVDDEVSLGHRRLSIVDLPGGAQPLFNEDRTIAVVFNGEIYNHRALRDELTARGHLFRTQSDTESIVHAYEEFGTACVERFDGMFAFVLYDRTRRKLFGARDPMGQKPLYYTARPFGDGDARVTFAFASELKSLRQHPAISAGRRINPQALVSYLLHDYVAGEPSIDDGVNRLPAGHAFEFGLDGSERAGFRQWRYFQLDYNVAAGAAADEIELGDEVLRLLGDAAEKRLMADVPLGVFLSGGIDSSTLIALLRGRQPELDLQTFSIAFEESSFDESAYAERVARQFGTTHHVRRFSATDLVEQLPAVSVMLDEPYADPSILPTSLLCDFARQRVTVAVGGDGGDELFAGYEPFLAVGPARLYRALVPQAVHEHVVQPAAALLPVSEANKSLRFQLGRFLRGAREDAALRGAVWMGPFTLDGLRRLVPDLSRDLSPEAAYEPLRQSQRQLDGASDLTRTIDFFQRFYLPDDILTKIDRAGMMHSLEVRAPFMDRAVVKYVNALPEQMKLRRGTTKYLLKQALARRGLLPREILRRGKKGFGIPVARWIRRELRETFTERVVDTWPAVLDMFDRDEIRRYHRRHLDGAENHYKELWALFMLAEWAREHGAA